MKQELMKLSNDEMQSKWKTYIQVACAEYKVKQMKEFWDKVLEAIRQFAERIKNAFKGLLEDLSELKSVIQKCGYKNCKTYPHSFPHYVDNLKLNTRGFPQPVIRCARSRC